MNDRVSAGGGIPWSDKFRGRPNYRQAMIGLAERELAHYEEMASAWADVAGTLEGDGAQFAVDQAARFRRFAQQNRTMIATLREVS